MYDWSYNQEIHYAPQCFTDVEADSFLELLRFAHRAADLDYQVKTAFVLEYRSELLQEAAYVTLDAPDKGDKEIPIPAEAEKITNREREMLEELPLPGSPIHEIERKKNGSSYFGTLE